MYYKCSDMKTFKIEPETPLLPWKLLLITKISFHPYTHIKAIINCDFIFTDIIMEISMDNLSMYEQQPWKFHSYLCISFLIVLFIFSGDVKCIFKCKKKWIKLMISRINWFICFFYINVKRTLILFISSSIFFIELHFALM